eukprot:scaffold37412_cov153-Amphora_coffeaeformis.AAC.1
MPDQFSEFVLLLFLSLFMTTTLASHPHGVHSRSFPRLGAITPVASSSSVTNIDALGCRGGALGKENKKNSSSSKHQDEKDTGADVDDGTTENDMETYDAVPLSIGSLFRLSNEIKAQAAAPPEGPISPHNKGRGGALAVMKAPVESRTAGLFGAFDTSSVKPLSSRLIQDDETKAPVVTLDETQPGALVTAEKLSDTPTTTTTKSAQPQNLWWNNAWQQQFPDGAIIEEIEVMAQDAPSEASATYTEMKKDEKIEDEEEGFDELEGIVQAEKEERKKKKVEYPPPPLPIEEVPVEAIEALPQSDDGDSPILPIPEEAASQESIMLPDATPESSAATKRRYRPASAYESSGYWGAIDNVFSIGLAGSHPSLRLSRRLRVVRKQVASVTGLHGAISGKSRKVARPTSVPIAQEDDEHMGMLRRRLAAIDRARGNLGLSANGNDREGRKRGIFGRLLSSDEESLRDEESQYSFILQQERNRAEAKARQKRVQEIDEQIAQGQKRLLQLATEKDILQRRPNPLWNYTTTLEELDRARRPPTENSTAEATKSVNPSRQFNFPPPDLVDEYLTILFASGRL